VIGCDSRTRAGGVAYPPAPEDQYRESSRLPVFSSFRPSGTGGSRQAARRQHSLRTVGQHGVGRAVSPPGRRAAVTRYRNRGGLVVVAQPPADDLAGGSRKRSFETTDPASLRAARAFRAGAAGKVPQAGYFESPR